MASSVPEAPPVDPGLSRSKTDSGFPSTIDQTIPLRVATLGPDSYNLPVPSVRYRIDLKYDEGSGGPAGWFVDHKPFRLQVEPPTVSDSPKPILEIVSEIVGSHRAKLPMLYLLPPAPTPQPPAVPASSSVNAVPPAPSPPPNPFTPSDFVPTIQPPTTFDDVMIRKIVSTRVIIYSTHVIEFLRSTITYYPQQSLLGDTITVQEPFGCLLHNYEKIKAACEEAERDRAAEKSSPNAGVEHSPEGSDKASHLQALLEFTESRREVQGLTKFSITPAMAISFDSLWFLFKPGEDVYFLDKEVDDGWGHPPIWQYGVISECSYGTSRKELPSLRIKVWGLGCDGGRFDRSVQTLEIPTFWDEIDPTSLRVIPAGIWDSKDNGHRRQELVERGKRVLQLLRAGYTEMWCSGRAIRPKETDKDEYDDVSKPFNGKVVLDNVGADLYSSLGNPQEINFPGDTMKHSMDSELGPDRTPQSPWVEYEDMPLEGKQFTEHQLLLLIPYFAGFALGPKEWIVFPVDSLLTIDRAEDPLKNLVVPSKGLDFIKSLALQSISPQTQWNADFIRGKGAGHIVLLHGPPGVGKTYTVECIAELIARPLINLTIADIGTDETSIESQLDKFFAYAERWKAILLIDEADIFLERRKNADIARNGIVGVFLRKTEYFSGMLFLTTNRVGLVDDAFISRAHIVLHYEELTDDSRKSIWEAFFLKLRKETKGKIVIGHKAKDYLLKSDDIKSLKWNGREIRNAFQTAITLAQYDAHEDRGTDYNPEDPITLTEDHFSRVADMSKSFKEFLFKLTGRTQEQAQQDRKEQY